MSEFTGIYQGVVVDRIDPEGKGRIRAMVPQALGAAPSNWATPTRPTKTAPAIGETVHVQFLNGDPTKPVYIADPVVKQEQISDDVKIEPSPGEPGQVTNLRVEPGIKVLYLTWDGVENENPVEYLIRAATSDIEVETTVPIGKASGTMHTLRVAVHSDSGVPDKLDYDTDYNICVQAVDIFSNEATGSPSEVIGPVQIERATGEDIAVGSIAAENLAAESITGDKLAVVLLLASIFKTAESGRRVEVGPSGIQLYDSDGSLVVDFPTDEGVPASFYGEVIAQILRVLGGATFEGVSTIAPSAKIQLSNKVDAPLAAPSISFTWDFVPLNRTTTRSGSLGTFAFSPTKARSLVVLDDAFAVSTEESLGTRVWYFSKTTGAITGSQDLLYLHQAQLGRSDGTVDHAGPLSIAGHYAPDPRANWIMNPSFEGGTVDYIAVTGATASVVDYAQAIVGTKALRLAPSGSSTIEVSFTGPDSGGRHAVTASSTYSFSLFTNTPAFTGFFSDSFTNSPTYQTGIQWFTVAGVPISTAWGTARRATSGVPVRVFVETVSPSNAAFGLPLMRITNANQFTATEYTYVDCCLLERGALGDYFDGDNYLRYDQDWVGEPNDSFSVIVKDGVEYRRNLVHDPAITTLSDWTFTGMTGEVVPNVGIVPGSNGLRVTPDMGWTPDAFPRRIGLLFDTIPDVTYTASMYVKRETPAEADNVTILVNGAATGTNNAVSVENEVKRLFVTFTATGAFHTLAFWFNDLEEGDTVLLSNPMIEVGDKRNYYFNGDTAV